MLASASSDKADLARDADYSDLYFRNGASPLRQQGRENDAATLSDRSLQTRRPVAVNHNIESDFFAQVSILEVHWGVLKAHLRSSSSAVVCGIRTIYAFSKYKRECKEDETTAEHDRPHDLRVQSLRGDETYLDVRS